MRALLKDGPRVGVVDMEEPALAAEDDVLVRVVRAGICRTDVYAAEGRLPCKERVVLGHELAGVVVGHGARACATGVAEGDHVTVDPRATGGFPGVERDGVFAELVVVPAGAIVKLPKDLPFEVGAYVEPVAAALAVLGAGLARAARGVVYGDGRISLLTYAVLTAHGFERVERIEEGPLPADAYDFAVETSATTPALQELTRALRVRGTLVLKSRPAASPEVNVREIVTKELTLRGVAYGSFEDAVALLAGGRLALTEHLGPTFPLERFVEAFAASTARGARKVFFAPEG
jgi:L-iditol 2-dehydrogenase